MAREVMNIKQLAEVCDALKLFCTSKDGFAAYKPGMDDEGLLKYVQENGKTGRPFNMNHIKNTRHELYGQLPSSKGKAQPVDIAALTRRVENLEKLLADVMEHPALSIPPLAADAPQAGIGKSGTAAEAIGYRGTKFESRAVPKL